MSKGESKLLDFSNVSLPFFITSEQISNSLTEKKASSSCMSCGSTEWTLIEEAAVITQWSDAARPPFIPVGVLICSNCGFVRMHTLKQLGLLPDSVDTPVEKPVETAVSREDDANE